MRLRIAILSAFWLTAFFAVEYIARPIAWPPLPRIKQDGFPSGGFFPGGSCVDGQGAMWQGTWFNNCLYLRPMLLECEHGQFKWANADGPDCEESTKRRFESSSPAELDWPEITEKKHD